MVNDQMVNDNARPAASGVDTGQHDPTAAITCGFCGTRFDEDPSQATCQACPLSKACGFVRCPSCGYENPKPPRWISKIRKWVTR